MRRGIRPLLSRFLPSSLPVAVSPVIVKSHVAAKTSSSESAPPQTSQRKKLGWPFRMRLFSLCRVAVKASSGSVAFHSYDV